MYAINYMHERRALLERFLEGLDNYSHRLSP